MLSDSTKWIGYIPMYNDNSGAPIQWDNDMYYMSGSEYVSKFYGASGHPALSCDPNGNLACAFSTPCTARPGTQGAGSTYYCRTILVSYKNVEEGYWHQLEDGIHSVFSE